MKPGLSVLIDDDPLVRMTWKQAAKAARAELRTFDSIAAFEAAVKEIPFDVAIYIDSNLGSGVRGEDYARELRERGFKCIHLATGSAEIFSLERLNWLSGIRDKTPPFGA